MNKLNYVLGIFLILILTTTFAATTLPNGENPQCMQIATGNFDSVAMINQNDWSRIKATGVNCITFDLRGGDTGWAWRGANDYNFEPYVALGTHVFNNYGLYWFYAPVWTTTGYYPTWLKNSGILNQGYDQNGFPTATAENYQSLPNTPSIWDRNYLDIQNPWYNASCQAMKNVPGFAGILNGINEGYELENRDVNTFGGDLNYYWHSWLNTKYDSNVTKLNQAWGYSFSAITDANLPINNSNPVQMKDFWSASSDRVIELYESGEAVNRACTPNAIIMGVKITTPSVYTNDAGGTGYVGYRKGWDINKYIATTIADYITFDPYPNDPNLTKQNTYNEANMAIIKAMADKANKPIYIGELFPTITTGRADSSTSYFNSMLGQTLGFVGATTNTGVRAVNYYLWSGLGGTLDIKDTATESAITKLSPLVQYVLENSTNTSTNNIAMYDNFKENLIYSNGGAGGDFYYRTQAILAAVDSTKKWSNKPISFYYNSSIPTNSIKALYVNNSVYNSSNLLDLNTWVANGGALLFGYRVLETDENHRSSFGLARTGTALGMAGVNLTNWQSVATLTNVKGGSTRNILSDIGQDQNFFKYISAGDLSLNYENPSSVISGWTAEGTLNAATTAMLVTNNAYGSGTIAHFLFQIAQAYPYNQTNSNQDANAWNYAWKDVITSEGASIQTATPDLNYYTWDTSDLTIINAFGTTSGSTNLIGGKDFLIIKADKNVLTYSAYKSTPSTFNYNPGLDTNQTKIMFKGNSIVAKMNINDSSDANLLINNENVGPTLPITASIHDATTIYIDSNVDGNISGQVLFSSPICTTIRASYTNTSGVASNPSISCNGRDGIIYLASIEDSNATNRNVIVLNSSTTAIVPSNACDLVDLIPIILAAAILIGLVIAMQMGIQLDSNMVAVLVVGAIVGVIAIVVYSSVIVSFCA